MGQIGQETYKFFRTATENGDYVYVCNKCGREIGRNLFLIKTLGLGVTEKETPHRTAYFFGKETSSWRIKEEGVFRVNCHCGNRLHEEPLKS